MQENKSKLIVYGYKCMDESILTEETKEEHELSVLIQQQALPDFFSSMALDFKCLVAQIACGNSHGLILATEGLVFSFGSNQFGQRGIRVNMRRERENNNGFCPTIIDFKEKMVNVSAGLYHSAAVSTSGIAFTWGRGIEGQLGQKQTDCVEEPMRVESLTNVQQVVCGGSHTLFLTRHQKVFAAGDNQWGQLGAEKKASTVLMPTPLPAFASIPITQLAAGCEHSVFLSSDSVLHNVISFKNVYVCGNNLFGQCGIEGVQNIEKPTKLPIKEKVVKIYSSLGTFSAFKTSTGNIFVWGTGSWGHARKPTNLMTNCTFQNSKTGVFKDIVMGDNYALTINENSQVHLLGTHKLPDIKNPIMECRLLNIESSDRMSASNRFILVAKSEDSKVSVRDFLSSELVRRDEPLLDMLNKPSNRKERDYREKESRENLREKEQQKDRELQREREIRDKEQLRELREQRDREGREREQREKEQREREQREREHRDKEQKEKESRDKEQKERENRDREQREREQRERDQREREQRERDQREREQREREQRDREFKERDQRERDQKERELREKELREQKEQDQREWEREQRDVECRRMQNQVKDTSDYREWAQERQNRDTHRFREEREGGEQIESLANFSQRETVQHRETVHLKTGCVRCSELSEKLGLLQTRLSNQEDMMANYHRDKAALIEQCKKQNELIEQQRRLIEELRGGQQQPRTPEKPIETREYSFTGTKNTKRSELPLTLQHSYSQHSIKQDIFMAKENAAPVEHPVKLQGSLSYQKLSQVLGDQRNEHRPYEIRSITPLETRTMAIDTRHDRLHTQEARQTTPSEQQQQYLSQRDSDDSQPVESSIRQNLNKSRGLIQSIDSILTQFKSMNQIEKPNPQHHHEKSKSSVTEQQSNPNTLIKSYFQRIEQLQQNIARSKQELRKSLEASKFCSDQKDDEEQHKQIDMVPISMNDRAPSRHSNNVPIPRKQPFKPTNTIEMKPSVEKKYANLLETSQRPRDKKSQMIRLEYRRNDEDQKLRTLY